MFGKNKNELHNRQILNEREKKKHIEHIEHTHTHTHVYPVTPLTTYQIANAKKKPRKDSETECQQSKRIGMVLRDRWDLLYLVTFSN